MRIKKNIQPVVFDTPDLVNIHVMACKKVDHKIHSWDNIDTLEAGYVCETCKKAWISPVYPLTGLKTVKS